MAKRTVRVVARETIIVRAGTGGSMFIRFIPSARHGDGIAEAAIGAGAALSMDGRGQNPYLIEPFLRSWSTTGATSG